MWWQYILILASIFVALIFLNIGIGLLISFYFRKCPICGKLMTYEGNIQDSEGNVKKYIFSCHHCGDIEEVPPTKIFEENT